MISQGFYLSLIGLIASFLAGWHINGWRLNADIESLHATWNQAYSNQVQLTLNTERDLTKLNQHLETSHASANQKIHQLYVDNRRLAQQLGGLRDPASANWRTLPKTDTTCQCAGAAREGRLSDQATQFLLELARDADSAAEYANTCHQWAVGVTQELNQP